MIETLEGRSMFAAVVPTDVAPPDQQLPAVQQDLSAAKVTMQDFHFVMKVNKASPKLFLAEQSDALSLNFTKIKFQDILVSAQKVKVHDISFTQPTDVFSLNFTKIKFD